MAWLPALTQQGTSPHLWITSPVTLACIQWSAALDPHSLFEDEMANIVSSCH